MSDCRHLRQTDEPNGWTVCMDCDANIIRWASLSALDVPLDSPAIRRIIEELKADHEAGIPTRYNRTYSRHNRS